MSAKELQAPADIFFRLFCKLFVNPEKRLSEPKQPAKSQAAARVRHYRVRHYRVRHYKWYVGFLLRQLFPRNNSNSYSISISYSTSHCAPHVSQCASYGAQGVITLVVQGFSDTGGTMWASSPTDSMGILIDFHQQKSPGGAYRRDDVGIVPYEQHGKPHRFSSTKIPRRGI